MSNYLTRNQVDAISKKLLDGKILLSDPGSAPEPWSVGVDLGTCYTVLFVLDALGNPLAGSYKYSNVVRDGLVVDFFGAVDLLNSLKTSVEEVLGCRLSAGATAFPPGVPRPEVRATEHVLESAGIECVGTIDEPSAANMVLNIQNGAIVDVGGGTTGIAVVQNGKVIYTADEPTGGHHFTLTIAGSLHLEYDEAERLKINPEEQERLFPIVRPVMEKVANITLTHIDGLNVKSLYLVGGSCNFPHMAEVVTQYTGIPSDIPMNPLFVTPLGIALYHGNILRQAQHS